MGLSRLGLVRNIMSQPLLKEYMLLSLFHMLLELYEIVMHEEAHFGISRKKNDWTLFFCVFRVQTNQNLLKLETLTYSKTKQIYLKQEVSSCEG